jgi:hypothetical protein
MSGGFAVGRYVLFALAVFVAFVVGCDKKAPDTPPAQAAPVGEVKGEVKSDGEIKSNTPVETLRTRGALLTGPQSRLEGPIIYASLIGAKFGDNDVALLKTIPTLRIVALSKSRVTDAGLAALADLPELQTLFLTDTAVTDAGLVHLRKFTRLNYLHLDGTAVTDAGVESLKSLTSLVQLDVRRTKVTDSAVARLKATNKRVAVVQDTKYFPIKVSGQFSAEFPWTKPVERTRTQMLKAGGKFTDTVYETRDESNSTGIAVADFASPHLMNVNLEHVVNESRDAIAVAINGKVTTDKRTLSGELVIRDIIIEMQGRRGQGSPSYVRYVISGRRVYTLTFLCDGEDIPPDVKDQFFNSFKVLR